MASRYTRLEDDRELDPPHVSGRCDDCGRAMTVKQEALDALEENEPLRCRQCAEEIEAAKAMVLAWMPVSVTRH